MNRILLTLSFTAALIANVSLAQTTKKKTEVVASDTLKWNESQGITSTVHGKNIGKIIFSKETIEFQNEDSSKFTTQFVFGDKIKFRAFFKESSYNSLAHHYTANNISKTKAFELGGGGFRPKIVVKYYVDGTYFTERTYKGEFNEHTNPPMGSDPNFDFLCKNTTYRGTLYDVTYAHEEIDDFTAILSKLTPGKHTIKLEAWSVNYSVTEEQRKASPDMHQVLLASGEFSFDMKGGASMSDNEAVCIPKTQVTSAEINKVVMDYLTDQGIKPLKLGITKTFDGQDIQEIHFAYGVKGSTCKMEFLVIQRSYNYMQKRYMGSVSLKSRKTTDLPCQCLE